MSIWELGNISRDVQARIEAAGPKWMHKLWHQLKDEVGIADLAYIADRLAIRDAEWSESALLAVSLETHDEDKVRHLRDMRGWRGSAFALCVAFISTATPKEIVEYMKSHSGSRFLMRKTLKACEFLRYPDAAIEIVLHYHKSGYIDYEHVYRILRDAAIAAAPNPAPIEAHLYWLRTIPHDSPDYGKIGILCNHIRELLRPTLPCECIVANARERCKAFGRMFVESKALQVEWHDRLCMAEKRSWLEAREAWAALVRLDCVTSVTQELHRRLHGTDVREGVAECDAAQLFAICECI